MKKYKKLAIGLALVLLFLGINAFVGPSRVEAQSPHPLAADAQACIDSLVFEDIAHIVCTTRFGEVRFTDDNPSDDWKQYKWDGSIFCSNPKWRQDPNKVIGEPVLSLKKDSIYNSAGSSGPLRASDVGAELDVFILLGVYPNDTSVDCFSHSTRTHEWWEAKIPGSRTQRIRTLLRFEGNEVLSLDGVNSGDLNDRSLTFISDFDADGNGRTLWFHDGDVKGCDSELVKYADLGGGSHLAVRYKLKPNSSTLPGDVRKLLLFEGASNCGIDPDIYGDYSLNGTNNPRYNGSFHIKGNPPQLDANPCNGNDLDSQNCKDKQAGRVGCVGPTCQDDDSCEINAGPFSLSWILCPLTTAAQNLTNALLDAFEDQLSFKVSDLKRNQGQQGVQTAWGIIKNIATALLVVIMLVMVISQAASIGPFDAYTLRKMLPKLVIAVIAMQLSWIILSWVVDFFDDLGKGLQILMYLPFGGKDQLDLGSLLANARIGGSASFMINWIGILAGGLLALAALPTVAFFALVAVLSLFTALAVLIFRKVLIILLLIMAPLAILAWILPGTERYWKFWSSNFIKVLAMYPLIVAFIAAGRIFSWTTGPAGGNALFSIILVMIGFFGPLFLLPKTFAWGGSLMALAANGATRWRQGLAEKPLEAPLKAWATRRQKKWVDKSYKLTDKGEEEGKRPTAWNRARGIAGRQLYATIGGRPWPTKRQRRQLLDETGQWKKEELDLREGEINNGFKEFLAQGHSVKRAKELTRDKYFNGTDDAMTKEAFFQWGHHTKSYLEFGHEEWRKGGVQDEDGKWSYPNGEKPDMFKGENFIKQMNRDPEMYSTFSQLLPRHVPFRQAMGGGPRPDDYLPNGSRFKDLSAATQQRLRANDDAKLRELLADDAAFDSTLRNTEHYQDVTRWRPEHYREMSNITRELETYGVKGVARARWDEMTLKEMMTGPGRYNVQPLSGGGNSAERWINEMHHMPADPEKGELGWLQNILRMRDVSTPTPDLERALAAAAATGAKAVAEQVAATQRVPINLPEGDVTVQQAVQLVPQQTVAPQQPPPNPGPQPPNPAPQQPVAPATQSGEGGTIFSRQPTGAQQPPPVAGQTPGGVNLPGGTINPNVMDELLHTQRVTQNELRGLRKDVRGQGGNQPPPGEE